MVGDTKRVRSRNLIFRAAVPDEIVAYCNLIRDNETQENLVTPFMTENLKKFRIIVTTLVFAGKYTRSGTIFFLSNFTLTFLYMCLGWLSYEGG